MRKCTMLGLAAVLAVVLSLVGASTVLANPVYTNTATTEVGQSITVDVLVDDPFPDSSFIPIVGGNCFTFDGRNVTYTPPAYFVGGEVDTCGFVVFSPIGPYDSALTVSVTPVTPTNTAPNALFNSTVTPGVMDVGFDASASTDADVGDSIVSYVWDFGDGASGTSVTTSHTYSASDSSHCDLTANPVACEYDVTLTVTDSHGATGVLKSAVMLTAPTTTVDQKPIEVVVQNDIAKTATGSATITFPIKLSRASVVPITLNYSVENGTASVTSNSSGSLVIPAGVTSTQLSFNATSNGTNKGAASSFSLNLSTSTTDVKVNKNSTGVLVNNDK